MHSARPTTFATASTCSGVSANSSAAASAPTGATSSSASIHTSTEAAACQSTFTACSQCASPFEIHQSNANVAIVSGRYCPPRPAGQYGLANARHIPSGCVTSGLSTTMPRSSST